MLQDNQLLPYFIRSMKQMKELLHAEQQELDHMLKIIEEQEKQLCIDTAEEKLHRYEQLFLLKSENLTINERRRNIKAKLNARITARKSDMIYEIQQLTGHPTEIEEYYDQYYFMVGLVQNDLSSAFVAVVRNYLDEIKPAHLGYDLSLIRYEETTQRIGGNMIMSSIMTWDGDLNGI